MTRPHDWTRARLDYLKELPEPSQPWFTTDEIDTLDHHSVEGVIVGLSPAALKVAHEVKGGKFDISEVHRHGFDINGRMFSSYQLKEPFWNLIQELREERAEFECGDGVSVHHVEGADSRKSYTCGNEFCDARYTREQVREAFEEVDR